MIETNLNTNTEGIGSNILLSNYLKVTKTITYNI